ncbi:hypothetical protein A3E46_00825 [Candidatus Woesebacteria bacterium RIFCSPHIGHO2_12_FULL_46_16]|uniref:M23ase beta-sheet core domain-containing protein n=1 Tax=Candidatus Woesebacteria bacterium RIFCSPHIGHO2_12_FULL_46_16 TaxID=1802513 RepID=A0A1F8AXJ9_9BACT|nr:MAG: hypothetical protein A3E46_00825 [Candidatus Woesebacteria bacterium RIFCSPHIGHO2_12_FULL_46_16]
MTKITLHLPKHRLHIELTKRRGPDVGNPLFPDMDEIKNIKKGHKISRFFRHIFEHKNIRRLLGTNLALMLIASTLVPSNSLAKIEAEQSVIQEQSGPLTTKRVVQYPTEEVKITQGYRLFHPGIDLDGVTGDKIRPIKDGKVEAIDHSKFAYGNAVIINHGSDITSLYAHLSEIFVSEGQEVTTNTVIGEMGATGRAFGDHLHLEVRNHGIPINPYSVLPR